MAEVKRPIKALQGSFAHLIQVQVMLLNIILSRSQHEYTGPGAARRTPKDFKSCRVAGWSNVLLPGWDVTAD